MKKSNTQGKRCHRKFTNWEDRQKGITEGNVRMWSIESNNPGIERRIYCACGALALLGTGKEMIFLNLNLRGAGT